MRGHVRPRGPAVRVRGCGPVRIRGHRGGDRCQASMAPIRAPKPGARMAPKPGAMVTPETRAMKMTL